MPWGEFSVVTIHEHLKDRYLNGDLEHLLDGTNIRILKDFQENWDAVVGFNNRYYGTGIPKIVLCGINPGRLGAGKTGIPFIDFESLSRRLPGVSSRTDSERSAQFFSQIVDHFGAVNFYASLYVTNISFVGYAKNSKNVNFDMLPTNAQYKVQSLFCEEMDIVRPSKIISLSRSVHDTVSKLMGNRVDCETALPHPYYCSFKGRVDRYSDEYIRVLTPFVKT